MAPDTFRTRPCTGAFDRLYGGQLLAQSVLAAGATVPPGRGLHSLHAYYLRLGAVGEGVGYDVRRLRDSRSFSTRSASSHQGGRALSEVMVSFVVPGGALAHQDPMPEVPGPDSVPSRRIALDAALGPAVPINARAPWPIDVRHVIGAPWVVDSNDGHALWLRTKGRLPDDPLIHAAALAYSSDLAMYEPVMRANRLDWAALIDGRGGFGASIDHTLWIHRSFRADEWLLHVQHSPTSSGSHGLTTGQFWSEDGRLVASVAQEVVMTIGERPSRGAP